LDIKEVINLSKKYLSVDNNGYPIFKDDSINEILTSDTPISDELYYLFFTNQNKGNQYKVKSISGSTFDTIFEEYNPSSEYNFYPSFDERLSAMEKALAIQLGV
jgi:hypothetical protein